MNVVFFGSSQYSTIIEKKLHEVFGLSLVITIPPGIIGREKILTSSPVEKFAREKNIPVITAEKLTDDIIDQIEKVKPDFLVVADFGLILPKKLLQIPKKAPLNIHHSLLPKYRGPSPAPAAILAGDIESGVTIIKMAEGIDTGDIMAQKTYQLLPEETTQTLLTTLNTIGADLTVDVINNFQNIQRVKQDESQATLTKRYTKKDSYIDLSVISSGARDLKEDFSPPQADRNDKEWLERAVVAFFPWPGVWTRWNGKVVKFLPSDTNNNGKFLIQMEGKKPVTVKDFLNGYPESKEWIEKLLN